MGFRLPEFTRDWNVTPTTKISPGTALAKAQPGIAAAGAFGQAAQSIANTANVFYQREKDQQVRDSGLQMYTSISDFKTKNAGKQVYSAEELPDGVIPQGLETKTITDDQGNNIEVPNDEIPAHMVYSELLKHNMNSWVEAAASGITDNKARRDFSHAAGLQMQKDYTQAVINSKNQQVKYQRNEDRKNLSTAIASENFNAARALVKSSHSFTPQEKEEITLKIDKSAEYMLYDGVINTGNIEEIQKERKNLLSDEYSGPLTETEQRKQASLMTTAISRLTEKKGAKEREEMQKLKWDAETYIKAAESGERFDAKGFTETQDKLRARGETFEADKMTYAFTAHGEIQKLSTVSSPDRNAVIAYWESVPNKTSEEIHVLGAIQKANIEMTRMQNTDMVSHLRKVRPNSISTIDFSKPGAVNELTARVNQMVQAADDMDSFTGFLDNVTEMPQFAAKLEQMTWDQKADYIPQINNAVGKKHNRDFYDQLIRNGVETTFAVAGQISDKFGHEAAVSVLRGAEARKADPNLIGDSQMELDAFMASDLFPAYTGDPTMQKAMKTAFQNVYADMTNSAGGGRDTYDENRAATALQKVTGGIVEYNDSLFPVPVKGFTEKSMNRWIKDTSPTILIEQGFNGTLGEAKKLWKQIDNGDIQLLPRGDSQWVLIDSDSKLPIKNKGEDNAISLTYDPAASSRDTVKDRAAADAMARITSIDFKRATVTSVEDALKELEGMRRSGLVSGKFSYTNKRMLLREKRLAQERAKEWR